MSALMDLEDDHEHQLQVSLAVLSTLEEPKSFDVSLDFVLEACWVGVSCLNDENNLQLASSPFQQWITEWTRIGAILGKSSDFISPFELHALVSQTWRNNSSSEKNKNGFLASATFLLLCCRALRQCPHNPPRLRKRWKSLFWETVQLYQRQWWDSFCRSRLRNSNSQQALECSVLITSHYLLPSVWHVRKELLPHEPPGNFDFEASSMACAMLVLSQCLNEMHRAGIEPAKDSVMHGLEEKTFSTINDTLDGRWNLVWCHWWREQQRTTVTTNRQAIIMNIETSLSFWSCWRQDVSSEDEEDCAEAVCMARTVWGNLSVSLLTAASFFSTFRPLVLHPLFTWTLFFPHVAIMLEQVHEQQLGSEEDTEEDGHLLHSCQVQAFQLLGGLLDVTPPLYLALAPTLSRRQQRGNCPDHPAVQTFQLLSNHMVRTNALGLGSKISNSDSTACFHMMKQLLSKYKPEDQVALVQLLVDTCPHPGLKPKLLDLLRPLIASSSSTSEDIKSAQCNAWQFWDTLWGEIMGICFTGGSTTASSWETLINNAELCVSVLSLIQVWSIVGNNNKVPSGLENLQEESLKRLETALHASLRHWESTSSLVDTKPEEHHRLFLLESTLGSTIPVLHRCVS